MVDILLAGLVAGFAATVVLTIFQAPVQKGPGATGVMAGKITGRPPEQNMTLSYLLHFLYGTFWGVAFAWGVDAWIGVPALSLGTLFVLGLALGVALWAISNWFWTPVLGMDKQMAGMPRRERLEMSGIYLVLHLLYGGALGVVLSWLPTESTAPTLGASVPATGIILLALALLAGAAVHQRHQQEMDRTRRRRPAA